MVDAFYSLLSFKSVENTKEYFQMDISAKQTLKDLMEDEARNAQLFAKLDNEDKEKRILLDFSRTKLDVKNFENLVRVAEELKL